MLEYKTVKATQWSFPDEALKTFEKKDTHTNVCTCTRERGRAHTHTLYLRPFTSFLPIVFVFKQQKKKQEISISSAAFTFLIYFKISQTAPKCLQPVAIKYTQMAGRNERDNRVSKHATNIISPKKILGNDWWLWEKGERRKDETSIFLRTFS